MSFMTRLWFCTTPSSGLTRQDPADLPAESACSPAAKSYYGTQKASQESWSGYKLHIDAADGGVPLSCILTSASLHDSQVIAPPRYPP